MLNAGQLALTVSYPPSLRSTTLPSPGGTSRATNYVLRIQLTAVALAALNTQAQRQLVRIHDPTA